jgi:uncharacterized protein YecE (DUF72 family)
VAFTLIKVGCCGFPGGKEKYFRMFNLAETQETFYRLPKLATAEKWRLEAPEGFEFTVKAWQPITHPPTSPTWRKCPIKVGKERIDKYGLLRPTKENFEAWEKTVEICKALRAKICVVQCPPQFNFTPENVHNMKTFFSEIDRGGIKIAWEPRGDWKQRVEEVKALCEDLDLIHVTDILRYNPAITGEVVYARLHGLNPREYDYKYKYTDDDLAALKDKVKSFQASKVEEVYVLFNNVWMAEDASRFQKLYLKA